MKRVTVLMSTYYGEAYLCEQLDSILAQTYPAFSIRVRDDGSSDGTPAILARYAGEGKLTYTQGSNLGFLKSFFQLLSQDDGADYFAFSDQDDVWLPEKLSQAVQWLDGQDPSLPLCYHGAYVNTDQRLEKPAPWLPPKPEFTFRRCLTENVCSGFTMVINRSMREAMLGFDLSRLDFHDWLAAAIALGLGALRLDERVCALHRRLDTSATRDTVQKGFVWYFKSLRGDSNMKIRNTAFYEAYGERLPAGNKAVLELFARACPRNAWKKALYPRRWRYRILDEIAVRLAMLGGAL